MKRIAQCITKGKVPQIIPRKINAKIVLLVKGTRWGITEFFYYVRVKLRSLEKEFTSAPTQAPINFFTSRKDFWMKVVSPCSPCLVKEFPSFSISIISFFSFVGLLLFSLVIWLSFGDLKKPPISDFTAKFQGATTYWVMKKVAYFKWCIMISDSWPWL